MTLNLIRNELVRIDDVDYTTHARTDDGYALQECRTSFLRSFSMKQLICAFDEGRLERSPSCGKGLVEPRFEELPDRAREQALLREEVINTVLREHGPPPYSEADLELWLPDISQQINIPVSRATFRRWFSRHNMGGRRALAPRPAGKSGPRVHPESERILQKVIDENFMCRNPENGNDVFEEAAERTRAENRIFPDQKLPEISRATVYRRIDALDDEKRLIAQKGKEAADKLYKRVSPGPCEAGPYAVIEVDHTPIDCHFTTPDGHVIGRPWLVAAVDRYSRMCAGFVVTFEPPTAHTIMLLMRSIILGKGGVLERYATDRNEWPCRGRPQRIVCDNGMEFHGGNLRAMLRELYIDVEFCKTMDPSRKGRAERYFLTLNLGLIHKLPGTTLSRFSKDKNPDPAKFAKYPLEKFVEFLVRFVVDVYHPRPHARLNQQSPIDVWNAPPSGWEIDSCASRSEVDHACFYREYNRSINREGISLGGFYYHSEFARRLRIETKAKGRFEVRYNPLDLGYILLRDPSTGRFEQVPSVSPDAAGMSVFQRKALLRTVAESGGKRVEEVRASKRRLINEARATISHGPKGKGLRQKRKAARLMSKPADPDSLVTTQIPSQAEVDRYVPASSPPPQKATTMAPKDTEDDLAALAQSFGYTPRPRRAR